jgi:hypothetical protein
MAKKNRKSTPPVESAPAASPTSRTYTSRSSEQVFNPDNTYIKKDLKRIGILAGSIFAALIILYFVLPYISPLYAH